MKKIKVAIIGVGIIGTDLMIKIMRHSASLELLAVVDMDTHAVGLAQAKKMEGIRIYEALSDLVQQAEWEEIKIIFDATSAKAHPSNWEIVKKHKDKKIIDLTPAAIGSFLIPSVNFDESQAIQNVNLVSSSGQATIPIIAAINRVVKVHYGEIVTSIASKSAGHGTRANIDEITKTTARAIQQVGGAEKGKAILILNPAEPPIAMRNTIFTLSEQGNQKAIEASIDEMMKEVQKYVPGYTLHQAVQFDNIPEDQAVFIEDLGYRHGLKTTIVLKLVGAGDYLPAYAGNLDVMTGVALGVGEKLVRIENGKLKMEN